VAQPKILSIILLASSALCIAAGVHWDGKSVPITVQVSKDVPVRSIQKHSQTGARMERGTLYSKQEFVITAGEQFRVTELSREGMCTIEYRGRNHFLHACPWMPGFSDPQMDIFSIIKVGSEK
jgi:hypothetical protein